MLFTGAAFEDEDEVEVEVDDALSRRGRPAIVTVGAVGWSQGVAAVSIRGKNRY